MELADYRIRLDDEGRRLGDAAAVAGWDAPVGHLDWTVREVVTHVGGVHRWASAIVATASPTSEIAEGDEVGSGPPDEELLEWFRDGHAHLVRTLTAAPDDLECVAFLPAPSPLTFWARRQLHETAVHRADVEAAAGAITPMPAALAGDGIAEMLLGFAGRRRREPIGPGVLALVAADSDPWRVELAGERVLAATGPAPDADATVSGAASDLYLWLWNRPADVVISGDAAVAAQWRDVRVRWS